MAKKKKRRGLYLSPALAAVLAVMGYSVNESVIIFDRIRENMRLNPRATLGELINLSINETLSRTVITSVTVVGALFVLYFMGGGQS